METKYIGDYGEVLTDEDISEMYEEYVYWTEFDGEQKAKSFNQWLNTQLDLGYIKEI